MVAAPLSGPLRAKVKNAAEARAIGGSRPRPARGGRLYLFQPTTGFTGDATAVGCQLRSGPRRQRGRACPDRQLQRLPHQTGWSPLCGGRPLKTPFGTINASNITADANTGIGSWSEAAFLRAMREGVRRDGAHLYPAFPYDHFTKASGRRPARTLRLPDDTRTRAGRNTQQRAALPMV